MRSIAQGSSSLAQAGEQGGGDAVGFEVSQFRPIDGAYIEHVQGAVWVGGDARVVDIQVLGVQRACDPIQQPDLVWRADLHHVEELRRRVVDGYLGGRRLLWLNRARAKQVVERNPTGDRRTEVRLHVGPVQSVGA